MDWLDALILGLVQGLAEYLPISSSGHLEICREVLGLQLAGAEALEFDTALHVDDPACGNGAEYDCRTLA